MKLELLVFGITGFLVVNTYYDGKYTKMLQIGHKYLKMAMFAFIGVSIYLFIKKNPSETKSMLGHANDIIRYMPIDKNTADLISPIFDFTSAQQKINQQSPQPSQQYHTPQMKRMMNSGKIATSRSVSETKKKYVASNQQWKCAKCHRQLDATFEIDHKTRLADGGSNHISNLEALCRNCHGEKTMMDKLS